MSDSLMALMSDLVNALLDLLEGQQLAALDESDPPFKQACDRDAALFHPSKHCAGLDAAKYQLSPTIQQVRLPLLLLGGFNDKYSYIFHQLGSPP